MAKVLLVDDDRDLVGVLRYTFQRDGFTIATAYDGDAALRAIKADCPDLVILDVMMPNRTGLQVLEELGKFAGIPVIVLTALGDEEHVIAALNLGADDYVVKPFRPRELKARAQALLRRSRGKVQAREQPPVPIRIGEVELDPAAREVTVAGRSVPLSRTEFRLLHYLMADRDTVVPVQEIVANVWGYESEGSDQVVKVTVSRLRRKLGDDAAEPRYIVNVPGSGYKFQAPRAQ